MSEDPKQNPDGTEGKWWGITFDLVVKGKILYIIETNCKRTTVKGTKIQKLEQENDRGKSSKQS